MTYRYALNRVWAVVSVLWITWCLYWPFYARRQDLRAIDAELGESYKLCLQQQRMTKAGCEADRDAYRKFDIRLTWPATRTVYQTFAGDKVSDALSLMAVVCLLPITFGYVLVRVLLELFLRLKRGITNGHGSVSDQTTMPELAASQCYDAPLNHEPANSPKAGELIDSVSPDKRR